MSLENEIRKQALINAAQFSGKASVKAVLGSVLAKRPEARENIGEIIGTINKIVTAVNNLSIEEQEKERKKSNIKLEEKKEAENKEELPALPNAKTGAIVTRFAPEPNGFIHFGHLKAAVLSNHYAKMYGGKAILRFDDTNPRKEKKEFYDAIKEDLDLMGFKWDIITKTSDHMDDIYRTAEELIKESHFYVCLCRQEDIKKNRENRKDCSCRSNSPEKNLELWKKMLDSFKEGEVAVRLKTDMKHRNPALRDPTVLRIVETPHPVHGNKYRVYPLYNFSTIVLDNKYGVNYVFRDKGFENDAMVQEKIYELLGWKKPDVVQFGRLKTMAGVPLSKRKQKELIDRGELSGFDDLRIPTPRNFLKRGFMPEALIKLMLSIGPSKKDIDVSEEILKAMNRKLIDLKANRYFFTANPIEMEIDGPSMEVQVPLHPDEPKRGSRTLKADKLVFVSKDDLDLIKKNPEIRLKGLFNVKIVSVGNKITAKYSGKDARTIPIIQWVPVRNAVEIKLILPDGRTRRGLAEESCNKLSDDVVQFERVGFARVVKENGRLTAYFAHR